MKIIALAVAALAISGCASVQQAVHGYGAAAIVAIRAAEDDNIALWTANACGTPISAAIRNPQIIPALRALCLPGGMASSPAGLLDAVQK
jgi:uncharacterized protein YceK